MNRNYKSSQAKNMDNRLTETQLAQVIAEIQQLSQRREVELDRQQVTEILQELNLPTDLLDDALVQIRRRQALDVQQRRNKLIGGGIILIVMAVIATTIVFSHNYQTAMERVSTYQSLISLSQNKNDNINVVDKQINPRVYYQVKLKDVPVGEKLSLSCDWIDPQGKIAHQNRYSTQKITTDIWKTYCYYQLDQNTKIGNWNVQMSLDGRILSKSNFVVK